VEPLLERFLCQHYGKIDRFKKAFFPGITKNRLSGVGAIDRSLKGNRFMKATGYCGPSWPELVRQLAEDLTLYEDWRRFNGHFRWYAHHGYWRYRLPGKGFS